MHARVAVPLCILSAILAGCAAPVLPPTEPLDPAIDAMLDQLPQPPGLEWQEAPPLRTAVQDAACTVYQDRIWLIGGINQRNIPSNAVQIYDPAAQRWDTEGYIPTLQSTGVHGGLAVPFEDRIQLVGGYEGLGRADATDAVYQFRTLFWTEANEPLPEPLAEADVIDFAGFPMILGGTPNGRAPVDDVLSWSTQTEEWTRFNHLPHARADMAAIYVESDGLFLAGGWTDHPHEPSGAVTSFDFESGSMREWPDIPLARTGAGHARVGDLWVFVGGLHEEKTTPFALAMDLQTKAWWRLPDLPINTAGACAVNLDGRLHVIGGTQSDGRSAVADHYILAMQGPDDKTPPPS